MVSSSGCHPRWTRSPTAPVAQQASHAWGPKLSVRSAIGRDDWRFRVPAGVAASSRDRPPARCKSGEAKKIPKEEAAQPTEEKTETTQQTAPVEQALPHVRLAGKRQTVILMLPLAASCSATSPRRDENWILAVAGGVCDGPRLHHWWVPAPQSAGLKGDHGTISSCGLTCVSTAIAGTMQL